MAEGDGTSNDRRRFLKGVALGSAAVTGAAAGLLASPDARTGEIAIASARAEGTRYKMAFIQIQPHTVPAAWSKGIEEVLTPQTNIDYKLLDGQNKLEVQVSLMDALINQGAAAIFLQP